MTSPTPDQLAAHRRGLIQRGMIHVGRGLRSGLRLLVRGGRSWLGKDSFRPSLAVRAGSYYPFPDSVHDLPSLLAACKSPSHRAWHEFAGMQPCTMCLREFEGWDV